MALTKERLQMGESGEEATIKYFKNNEKIHDYYDLRNNEEYWTRGIDFEVVKVNEKRFYVETKTIKGNHKNVSIQLYKIDTSKPTQLKPGWFYVSEAKYLFIYHENEKTLRIFDFVKLRKWYEDQRLINQFQIKAFIDNESNTRISVNVLIPFDLIKSAAYTDDVIDI